MLLPRGIFSAALSGNWHAVLAWLDGDAGRIDARDSEHGDTLLTAAALYGDEWLTSLLLQRGASVDLREAGGDTALMRAAHGGHAGVCGQLLLARARLDLVDAEGDTPLELVRRYDTSAGVASTRHAAVVELLTRTANARRALERLRRVAPLVGRWAIFLVRRLHEVIEAKYRPGGQGFEEARADFEAATRRQQQHATRD